MLVPVKLEPNKAAMELLIVLVLFNFMTFVSRFVWQFFLLEIIICIVVSSCVTTIFMCAVTQLNNCKGFIEIQEIFEL